MRQLSLTACLILVTAARAVGPSPTSELTLGPFPVAQVVAGIAMTFSTTATPRCPCPLRVKPIFFR